jgi:hypothetical protein
MSEWYVVVEGQARGPVSTDTVLAYLKTRNRAEVQVWRAGFDDWRLAKDIPELRATVPPPVPLIATRDPESSADAPSEITIPTRKSRKLRWSKAGAILGFLYSVIAIAVKDDLSKDLSFIVGYMLGGIGMGAIIGFLAGAVGDLFKPKANTSTQLQPAAAPIEVDKPEPRQNFVARHWRGELPLWVSYWIISLVAGFGVLAVVVVLSAAFASKSGYYPLSIFATFTGTWTCIVILVTWQLIGTWRSAERYKVIRAGQGRSGFWGGLAQVMVILGILSNLGTVLRDGAPQIVEAWRIAFQNDPDIPEYSIRVMRDGTEAEIVGGLKYGLADDFAKILNASRRVKVVHLDSVGGRLGEGEKLYKLIRSRGLDTYVSSKCMSACTMAFAAGRERYLRKGAVLGFHKGAFPGANDGGLDQLQRAIFLRSGFDPSFVAKALSTPNADMYKPEPSVLLSARVVTSLTDGRQFAFSGMGTEISKNDIEESLAKSLPVFATMKQRFPKTYDNFVEEFYQNIVRGKSEAETIADARTKLHPFITDLIPLANDDVLIDYAKILADQYSALNTLSVTACYQFAYGDNAEAVAALLPQDLVVRERSVQERVLRTAIKRPPIDPQVKEQLWEKLGARLAANGVTKADFEVIGAKTVDRSKHALYCAVSIIMFREISRMPQREGALLMRSILLER